MSPSPLFLLFAHHLRPSLPDRPHPEPNLSLHISFAFLVIIFGSGQLLTRQYSLKRETTSQYISFWQTLGFSTKFVFFSSPSLSLFFSGQICSSFFPFFSVHFHPFCKIVSIFQSSMMVITNAASQHEDHWGRQEGVRDQLDEHDVHIQEQLDDGHDQQVGEDHPDEKCDLSSFLVARRGKWCVGGETTTTIITLCHHLRRHHRHRRHHRNYHQYNRHQHTINIAIINNITTAIKVIIFIVLSEVKEAQLLTSFILTQALSGTDGDFFGQWKITFKD